MSVSLLFAKSPTLAGRLIRFFLFSEHNHVGVSINGAVYDASGQRGVSCEPESAFRRRWDVKATHPVCVPDVPSAVTFLESKIGRPYDWRALVSMPLRGSWHEPEAWFCSELCAAALIAGGMPLALPAHRVTPRDLLFSACDISGDGARIAGSGADPG